MIANYAGTRPDTKRGLPWMGNDFRAVFLFLFSLLAVGTNCSQRGKDLPDPNVSYEAFLRSSVTRICGRMLVCYRKIYRTASPAVIRSITQERCEEAALRDMDRLLTHQTATMKANSVPCYRAIVEAPCNKFAEVAYWNPSCMALRKESTRVYSKISKE